jgi:AbrB family looped-hinge helix DNA binding protein
MLVTIDKRGSISLPASLRKDLGIKHGTHLELSVEAGGAIYLYPVEFYRTIKLNDSGLLKLKEARDSETTKLPDWFEEERSNARIDSE